MTTLELGVAKNWTEKYHTQKWREAVLERDNYTCQKCGLNYSDCPCLLEAHHIKPVRLFPELALDIDNGETRCYLCHYESYIKMSKEEQFIYDVNILTRYGVAVFGDAALIRYTINRLEREEKYVKNR